MPLLGSATQVTLRGTAALYLGRAVVQWPPRGLRLGRRLVDQLPERAQLIGQRRSGGRQS